jgi:Ring finger domain
MESPFANQNASAAASSLFSRLTSGGNHFSVPLSRPSFQPGTAGLPVATTRVTSTARPSYSPSMSLQELEQALGLSLPASAFAFAPDPIAAGPTSAAPASARASLASASSPVAAARPPPRRRHSKTTPVAAAVAAAAPAALEPPGDGPNRPRRSARRKRAPAAEAEEATTTDPPAKKRRGNLKSPPPGSGKTDQSDDNSEQEQTASCCICMDEPKPADLASISGCDHFFCFECIEKWAERENTCPLCKVRFTKIDRVNAVRRKGGPKTTKRVKSKDQRSDIAPGAALEGLLASFASTANFPPHRMARLIFSGMGGNPFMLPGSAPRRLARAPNANPRQAREDALFSSDTDDDDEASFLRGSSFHELFRAGGPFGPRVLAGLAHQPNPPPIFGQATRAAAGRSYASNVGDRTAGRATNPLEIEDDSEEEIEVVQVTRTL